MTQVVNTRPVIRSLDQYLSETTDGLPNLVEGIGNRSRITVNRRRRRIRVITIRATRKRNVNRGLTKQRVDRFEHFALDESAVGHKCLVCQDDPAIGTQMVRLDCHVDHAFCEQCAVPWFQGHNTCPTCRQAFS